MFEIVLCSGCNQHGTCNFDQYREETKMTDPIKTAACDCIGDGEDPYWTGIYANYQHAAFTFLSNVFKLEHISSGMMILNKKISIQPC